jgi:hypothetical protein
MSTFEELFNKTFGRSPKADELKSIIDQSVTSYNQTGGITAHTVNIGPPRRELTDSLKQHLLTLPLDKPITVTAVMGVSDASELANEIRSFLAQSGFPMASTGIAQGVFGEDMRGLRFDAHFAEFIVGYPE